MKINDRKVKEELREIKRLLKESYVRNSIRDKDLFEIKAIGKLDTLLTIINWEE